MKLLFVATATIFFCLLNSEAKPLTLHDVELFAITPEEAVKRLEQLVKPHQQRVVDAIEQMDKDKLNLDELTNHVGNNYTDVKNQLKAKIEGYRKYVDDQKPPTGKCDVEKKAASTAITEVEEERSKLIEKEHDDCEKQKQKLSTLYEGNSDEYNNLKTNIKGLVGMCKNQFDEVHLIIACVGIGVQGFNYDLASIDSKKWKELTTETYNTANKAIDVLKKSLDNANFSTVTNALAKFETCVKGTPEEGNPDKPVEGNQGKPEEGNQGKPEDGNQGETEEGN